MPAIERPTSLTAHVAERLRSEILSGEIRAGEHLRQNEVAKAYGVSSTPVREAFAMLERDGLVDAQLHRGVTVVEPTPDDLREVYEIRIRLECLAIELACKNKDRDLAAIRALLDEMASLGSSDSKRYVQLNKDFHEKIYALADRPRLERLIADMRDASATYISLLSHFKPDADATQDDHEAIFAALEKGAAKAASKALAAHLQHTVDYVESLLVARSEAEA